MSENPNRDPSSRLPIVVSQVFLSTNGLVGVRCQACNFVLTARTLDALQKCCWEHDAAVHLTSDDEPSQNETNFDAQ